MSETLTAFQVAKKRLDEIPYQSRVEVMRGVTVRRKKNGLTVMSLHYSAVPDRDPETEAGKNWYIREKRKYSSEARWKKEQEIDPHATGGEAVFGKILSEFYQTVIISDPHWFPDPRWDVGGGFDHGIANATALLKCYIPRESIDPQTGKKRPPDVYLCGEYYSYRREGWDNNVDQNVEQMKQMPDMERARWILADPNIFWNSKEQEKGAPTNTYVTYKKNNMWTMRPYEGIRSDVSFVQWMWSDYWRGIGNGRKPRLYIVCRNPSDRPQPGLHPYDCPNLLWELKRAKRVEMTARQLLTKSQDENLQDKHNHLRDCLVAGTLVTTSEGEVPIEEVQVGQHVMTRKGWRRVEDAWQADPAARVLRVRFSDGTEITGTGRHKLYTVGDGFVSLDTLKLGAEALCLRASSAPLKHGCGWASASTDIQKRRATRTGNISRLEDSISTCLSGSSRTAAPSPKGTTFTIGTRTPETTSPITSKHGTLSRTWPITTGRVQGKTPARRRSRDFKRTGRKPPIGTLALREGHGTVRTDGARYIRCETRPVLSAVAHSKTKITRRAIVSARATAATSGVMPTTSTMWRASASYAAVPSRPISTTRRGSAPEFARVRVVEVTAISERRAVYDLTVSEQPEFFANGVLVHNCMKHITGALRHPTDIPIEEFIAENLKGLDPSTQHLRARFLMSEMAAKGQLGLDGKPKKGKPAKHIDMRRVPSPWPKMLKR